MLACVTHRVHYKFSINDIHTTDSSHLHQLVGLKFTDNIKEIVVCLINKDENVCILFHLMFMSTCLILDWA